MDGGYVKPDITYVIGYREGEHACIRRALLDATIDNIRSQNEQNIEILLVEDASESSRRRIDGVTAHFFIDSDEMYCRSGIANVGLCEASCDFVVMHDADVLMPEHYTTRMLNYLKKGHSVLHLGKYAMQMFDHETERVLMSNEKYNDALSFVTSRPPRKAAYDKPFTGYSIGMNVNTVKAIGGWNTKYIGWGYEDTAFIDKAKRAGMFYNPREITMIHMSHPRVETTENGKIASEANKKLYELQLEIPVNHVINIDRQENRRWKDIITYTKVKDVS